MIMLGSKFFPKGSLKCSQLGRGWLKNKQISYISPNFGGSGFRSQSSGVGFKGPAHILWSGLTCSLQGGATGEHSSCPWNPASNLSTSTHWGLTQRARHVAWLRRQGGETKKQVQPLVDGDTLLFLPSPPTSELLTVLQEPSCSAWQLAAFLWEVDLCLEGFEDSSRKKDVRLLKVTRVEEDPLWVQLWEHLRDRSSQGSGGVQNPLGTPRVIRIYS